MDNVCRRRMARCIVDMVFWVFMAIIFMMYFMLIPFPIIHALILFPLTSFYVVLSNTNITMPWIKMLKMHPIVKQWPSEVTISEAWNCLTIVAYVASITLLVFLLVRLDAYAKGGQFFCCAKSNKQKTQ